MKEFLLVKEQWADDKMVRLDNWHGMRYYRMRERKRERGWNKKSDGDEETAMEKKYRNEEKQTKGGQREAWDALYKSTN